MGRWVLNGIRHAFGGIASVRRGVAFLRRMSRWNYFDMQSKALLNGIVDRCEFFERDRVRL